MSTNRKKLPFVVASVAVVAMGAGCKKNGNNGSAIDDGVPNPARVTGATEFVSADAYAGEGASNGPTAGNAAGSDAPNVPFPAEGTVDSQDFGTVADSDGSPDTVQEGDIYRVLPGNLIANLNAFRGLQLIDFSNVEQPEIVGQLQISGTPVELYVVDNRVFLLMNNWRGYWGSQYDAAIETRDGGVAVSVDIADPSNPIVIDREYVPGYISRSRLTSNGASTALYVAASGSGHRDDGMWDSVTVVKSFNVSDGALVPSSEIKFWGYASDIQATPAALLVARDDWNGEDGSKIAVVDISDPTGLMQEGDEVVVAGHVSSQFNMDLYNGVLRVVSGSRWDALRTNHLQTYNATDLHNLTAIDHDTFGDNEDLKATLFVGNKAFFVSYFRTDPFHAFYIGDDGFAEEKSEFVVSGWNDFFSPVLDATCLVGIGIDDASGGRTMSVSLYDITDLANAQPLVARADVEAEHSWSEAQWDHRAFSVLDDAVLATASDGTEEKGLVLVPFSGWNAADDTYVSAVQIFTYSSSTLTRRGLMDHGTQVRRSFEAASDTTVNLSEAALSIFNTADPDSPTELGRLELAPNYTDYLVYGDYAARVKNSRDYYSGWWRGGGALPASAVEIVSHSEYPGTADTLATFEIPTDAAVYQTGDLLVTHVMEYVEEPQDHEYKIQSVLTVYDLTDPLNPTKAGSLTTGSVQPGYGGHYGYPETPPMVDCFDCGGYLPGFDFGNMSEDVHSVPGGLVFLQRKPEQQTMGVERICHTRPSGYGYCGETGGQGTASPPPSQEESTPGSSDGASSSEDSEASADDPDKPDSSTGDTDEPASDGERPDCHYYEGDILCRSLNGAEAVCSGQIRECYLSESNDALVCDPVDPDDIMTHYECWQRPLERFWQRFSLEVLDLTDPLSPKLSDTVQTNRIDEGVSVLAKGSDIWLTFRHPVDVANDARPYVRYFIQQVDLANISQPSLGQPINVPGELVAIDGVEIITRDLVFGESIVETAIAKLVLGGSVAELQSFTRFEEQLVLQLALDGDGRVLVSHRAASQWYGPGVVGVDVAMPPDEFGGASTQDSVPERQLHQLTILDQSDLSQLSQAAVDTWATLQDARSGRALFQVPGGLLVFNVEDAQNPYPQAYFATQGWPTDILVDGTQVIFPAGRYGIYAFDLDVFNLLVSESN